MLLIQERQLNVYDCLVDAGVETCPECPDPASCQADRECALHTELLLDDAVYPAFDPIDA